MPVALDRCPYPGCVLEEHDEGEHVFGRPKLPLLPLKPGQEFSSGWPIACDLHERQGALKFMIDRCGYGWALCKQCLEEYGRE